MLTHPNWRVFWPDEDYDREYASDGISRYAAYLRSRYAALFCEDGEPVTDPLRFAAAAWEVAGGPIMAPPYVRSHPRVLYAVPEFDDEQHLAMAVWLAGPIPPGTGELCAHWRGWNIDSSSGRWVAPFDCDRLTVLARIEIRVPIGSAVEIGLPEPRYEQGLPATATAKEAVLRLCGVLGGEIAGLLCAWGELR
jgi:hypothetical protein